MGGGVGGKGEGGGGGGKTGSLSIAHCNNGQFVGSFLTRINYAWPLIGAEACIETTSPPTTTTTLQIKIHGRSRGRRMGKLAGCLP